MVEIILALGIHTAVTGMFFGILKFKIEKMLTKQEDNRKAEEEERERKAVEREQAREELIMLQIKSSRAAITLSEATAKAVQRIPDARCNGDMTKALEIAAKIQREEKEFLFNKGIHSIYEE